MLTQLNIRQLTNGAIFVQYWQDGKSKDAAFTNWLDFMKWLHSELRVITPTTATTEA